MRFKNLAFATLLSLAVVPVYGQISDEQLVDNAYPQELHDSRDPEAPMRFSTSERADLNHNGQQLIVALYTNGSRAGISVLDQSGRVLSHPDIRSFKGYKGELQIVDLDGDHIPEIIARLYSGHGLQIPDSWVFAWRNGQLTLISPSQVLHGVLLTSFGQVVPLDLDGSGKLALLALAGLRRDAGDRLVSDGDAEIYVLNNGQYVTSGISLHYVEAFHRKVRKPGPATATFTTTPGRSLLHVVNGFGESAAVTSGHILVNGVEVIHAADFKPKAHVIDVQIDVNATNTLSVDLNGKPGSAILVMVESTH
jgi:hypothetical protein